MRNEQLYVLDTDCLTYFLSRASQFPCLVARIQATPRDCLAISVVTVQERMRGVLSLLEKNGQGPRAVEAYRFFREIWETLHEFRVLEYSEGAERIFAQLPPDVKRRGPRDCRIAATAIASNAIVVTHNTQDFARIPGVKYEDWTVAADLPDERTSEEFYESK